jgi:hypothetical protein
MLRSQIGLKKWNLFRMNGLELVVGDRIKIITVFFQPLELDYRKQVSHSTSARCIFDDRVFLARLPR